MAVRLNDGLWFGGLLGWLLALSAGCLLAVGPEFGGVAGLDKWLHLLAFATGGFWLALRLPVWPSALALVLLGLMIEAMQGVTTVRSAELGDAAMDVCGVVLGSLLAQLPGLQRWLRS